MWTKTARRTRIPFSKFAGRLKIQVDSFLTACTASENWMKGTRKQGYIYTFCFLSKIVTTEIWPSEVFNYSNKKTEETLCLSVNMINKSNGETNFPHEWLLINTLSWTFS